MGGYGSGRKPWRNKVDDCRSINVNLLYKAGCLRPGYWGGWQWMQEGEQVAVIGLRAKVDLLILKYRVRRSGEDWEKVEEAVPITWSRCRYGGLRPYFLCPGGFHGRPCGRRVTKLYGGGLYFLCRHCYDLTHASRSESRPDRLLRRANKIRAALGEGSGARSPFPPRPKGMHQRTYERLVNELNEAEAQAEFAFLTRTAQ